MLDQPLFGAIEGRVDIGYERFAWIAGTFPLWNIDCFPFFWSDSHEYEAALNDPRMKAIMDKTFAEAGLVKMFEGPSAALEVIYGNEKFLKVEDFKGAKIRAAGLVVTFSMELLGASPLTIPAGELVEAIKRGTVDGIHTNYAFGMEVGLTDVAKYGSIWPISSEFTQVFAINKDKFDSLPSDLQKIFRDVCHEMNGQSFVGGHEANLVALTAIRATPIEIITPEKAEIERAAQLMVPGVFDKWLAVAGPDGPEVLAIAAEYGSGPAAVALR